MTALLVKDHWTAADGTPWNPAIWTTVRNVRGTSPAPTTTSNTGRMVTSGAGTTECHILAALAPTIADQDISVTMRAVTLGGTYPPDPGMYPLIYYRLANNVDSGLIPYGGYALGVMPMRQRVLLYNVTASDYVALAVVDSVPIDNTAPHWYRIHAKGSRHQVKWWHTDGAEPPTWNIDVTDTTYTSGRTGLSTFDNDAHNNIEVSWDDFRLAELLPAEPGINMPEGATVAVQVGTYPVVQCFVGAVEIPVPS
jgi:hypothetical protein